MNEQIKNYKKTIEDNINLKSKFFWDINDTEIQKFKNNFRAYNEDIGHILLDMMLYYNANHCRELTSAAVQEIKRNIWLKALKNGNNFDNSEFINEYIQSYYKEFSSTFIPHKNHKPLSSLLGVIAMQKPKCIIFVDDIIGTGKQFSEFFSKTKHFNTSGSIEDCVNANPEIDFYYVVFAADELNLSKLRAKYKNLKIIAVEIFNNEDRITNKNNEYWEIYDKYNMFMKGLKNLEKNFPRTCKYSLDLPILYVSGRAQNTSFEYFWNNYNESWNVLKVR